MREKEVSNWVKRALHAVTPKKVLHAVAIAGIVVASFVAKDKAGATVNSEVGSLATEPILLILDPSQIHDLLQYKPWNLGSVGPQVEVSPEFFIRALDRNNIPSKLTLRTKVSKEGSAEVCAYNYPETRTCHNITGTDESSYPIDTSVLDPGKTYLEVGSTRFKTKGTGRIMIEMEIKDDQTGGLVASADTILTLLDTQAYFPLVSKVGNFSLN